MITKLCLKRQFLISVCIMLFLIVWAFASSAQENKVDVTWQKSESVSVQLGIRDKYRELTKYDALFVVTDSNGKEYKFHQEVSDDNWGYAYFPDDFSVYAKPGKYSWECIVNRDIVASGQFEYRTVDTHCDQVKVFRR